MFNNVNINGRLYSGTGVLVGTPSQPIRDGRYTVLCGDFIVRHYTHTDTGSGVLSITTGIAPRGSFDGDYSLSSNGRPNKLGITVVRGDVYSKGTLILPYNTFTASEPVAPVAPTAPSDDNVADVTVSDDGAVTVTVEDGAGRSITVTVNVTVNLN